jgi:hypothetical protein
VIFGDTISGIRFVTNIKPANHFLQGSLRIEKEKAASQVTLFIYRFQEKSREGNEELWKKD